MPQISFLVPENAQRVIKFSKMREKLKRLQDKIAQLTLSCLLSCCASLSPICTFLCVKAPKPKKPIDPTKPLS